MKKPNASGTKALRLNEPSSIITKKRSLSKLTQIWHGHMFSQENKAKKGGGWELG